MPTDEEVKARNETIRETAFAASFAYGIKPRFGLFS